MSEHELKCWPEYFSAILSGDKPFEVRKNDRGFKVGDTLWLREWGPVSGYTGNEVRCRVTCMLRGTVFGIDHGYVVMGLESPDLAALRQRHAELEAKLKMAPGIDIADCEIVMRDGEALWPDEFDNKVLVLHGYRIEPKERHAEAVEQAFREALGYSCNSSVDAAWLASEAKARLT